MRTPDDDGAADTAQAPLGDGFGATADDLTDGFGEDDFSDDAQASFDGLPGEDDSDGDDGDGTAEFGDGLSDDEAENILVEILEDVFGDDAPEVVDQMQASTGLDASELVEALDEPYATFEQDPLSPDAAALNGLEPEEGFDDTELPTKDDFDFTHDGQVDQHDLHEATHPFDFGVHGG